MPRASITFDDFEFGAGESRPWVGIKSQYISEAPGQPPQKAEVEYTVKTWFLEGSFADNQQRYRNLLAAINGATEGVLTLTDEGGHECWSKRVRVASHDLPEQWGTHLAEVAVVFKATEDLTEAASAIDMVITPSGGSAVTLPNVSRFAEKINATRYSPRLPHRRETIGSIVATGKIRANPESDAETRAEELLAAKAAIQVVADAKEGELVYLNFTKTIRIEVLDATIDGDELTWALQANYQRFPAGDYAEAEFTVSSRDDQAQSQRLTTVSGKVRADDEAGALAKVTTLQGTYTTEGRMLLEKKVGTPRVDCVDGATFVDVDFTFEFREVLAVTSYRLSISTRDDSRTGQVIITYSGSVTSSSTSAALTQARAIGDGVHPVRLSGQETIETTSLAGATAQPVQVAFSYEYLTKGTALWAEVTSDIDRNIFGANVQTVSGYAVADTEANAFTLARSFKPSGLMLRTDREASESVKKTDTTIFVKVSFSYSYHRDALAGSIAYAVKTSEDLMTRRKVTAYSGVAYGPDEATADALITALVSGETAGTCLVNDRESKFDKSGADTKFMSRSFTISFRGTIAAGTDDVLEAEWSVENVYSINAAILTFIPFGTAHVQTDCGTTIGKTRVTGRMTCLTLGTALTWARAKAPTGGNRTAEDAPQERVNYKLYEFSPTSVQAITLDFNYSMSYANLTM